MNLDLMWLINTAVTILVAQAVLGPVLIRFGAWKPLRPNLQIITAEALPGGVASTILPLAQGIQSLGFELVGYVSWVGAPAVTSPYLVMLVERQRKVLAVVVSMRRATGRFCYVEFATEFQGRSELDTNNSPQPGIFREVAEKKVFRFPDVQDVRRLYEIHRRLMHEHFPSATSVLPRTGAEIEEMMAGMERDVLRQVSFGHYYVDETASKYRPTWKGACLSVWKLIWPMSALRRAKMRDQAEEILKTLAV